MSADTAPQRTARDPRDRDRAVLVPAGGAFEGQVAVVGETRIEGTVTGSVRGPGELILGKTGRIEGVIECAAISSQGVVLGPMTARSRVHLGDGARFEGDLDTPSLAIVGDAVWIGLARVG